MRRTLVIVGAVVVIAFAFAIDALSEEGIQETPMTWKQASLADGEALYRELCAVCHGMDGKGRGPAAPALAQPVPDLTRLALANDGTFPAEEVEKAITGQTEIISHGTVEMPIWGYVFRDVRPDYKPFRREAFARLQILNLTSYLETLQEK